MTPRRVRPPIRGVRASHRIISEVDPSASGRPSGGRAGSPNDRLAARWRGSVPAMPREWDAETYDAIADPQFRWGSAVVDRLELDGAETVLDAGCGSGRVTARLAERLPRGQVVALDGST